MVSSSELETPQTVKITPTTGELSAVAPERMEIWFGSLGALREKEPAGLLCDYGFVYEREPPRQEGASEPMLWTLIS